MKRVVALSDLSAVSASVIETARTLSRLIGAECDVVCAVEDDFATEAGADASPSYVDGAPFLDADTATPIRPVAGPVIETLIDELAGSEVACGVVGCCRSAAGRASLLGHVAHELATTSATPIVLVPPDARPLSGDDLVFLVPLDGSARVSGAVESLVSALTARGGRVVLLHVYSPDTIPMFVSSGADQDVIAEDFAARHLPTVSTTTELRLGTPADEILDAARCCHADAIVLGWKQNLDAGHAEVVRRLLDDGRVPLILQPMTDP